MPTSMLERLAGVRIARRLTDVVVSRYAGWRVRQLDRLNTARVQQQTLLRLVRRARGTRFGRDHNFEGIRSVADFQQRVPLRGYEAFWSEYWKPAFPFLQGTTWPDPIPYLALSSGTTSGATKYIPVSRQMLASNKKAGLTTVSLYLAGRRDAALFDGRLFFLGGSTELRDLAQGGGNGTGATPGSRVLAGDLSGISILEVSDFLRPYTFPPLELALLRDWDVKMRLLAEESLRTPITWLSGVPSWILVLFERLLQMTGKSTISEVWPSLRLIIHGGTKFDPYRPLFEKLTGNPQVRFLETYPASEGFIATEDPRYDLLRVVPDHNLFFEFVPVGELDSDRPTRHTLRDLEVGVQYAVVLSSCAGVWGYVIGDTVCFERRDPPLLRFTGRTRYFLSAFGEHLISEEVERAVASAARKVGATVTDFHVGPVFPDSASKPGRHRYLVEFAEPPADVQTFADELDGELRRINEDYDAHRQGDLTMLAPEVVPVRRGGFTDWMRSKGKLGGQHKVPRMDNSGQLTAEMTAFFGSL